MSKSLTMKTGERSFTLRYDVQAMADAEEKYDSFDALSAMTGGNKAPVKATLDMLAYMANAGARHAGKPADFTAEWFRENLTPVQLDRAKIMIQQAIMVGLYRENPADDDVEIDVVLEKIRKKKEEKQEKKASPSDPAN